MRRLSSSALQCSVLRRAVTNIISLEPTPLAQRAARRCTISSLSASSLTVVSQITPAYSKELRKAKCKPVPAIGMGNLADYGEGSQVFSVPYLLYYGCEPSKVTIVYHN